MTNEITTFLELEPYLQWALPIGFLCYLIARMGLAHKDTTPIMVFTTFVFAALVALLWKSIPCRDIWKYTGSMMLPFLLAILWRMKVADWLYNVFSSSKVATNTKYPDTWSEITANPDLLITQVTVFLKNGDVLTSSFIQKYEEAPIKRMSYDTDGNIAMYVDRIKKVGEDTFKDITAAAHEVTQEQKDVYRLSYIPHSEILRIQFATQKKE